MNNIFLRRVCWRKEKKKTAAHSGALKASKSIKWNLFYQDTESHFLS